MACTFCATGTMGKIANLTAAEICEQVHHARIRYPSTKSWNVVFMGMADVVLVRRAKYFDEKE